jgi:hypothetical protein
LPSNWSITGTVGAAASATTGIVTFINSSVTSYSNSYLSYPIFQSALAATFNTTTSTVYTTWSTSGTYCPVSFGNPRNNTSVYPVLSNSYSTVSIKNGTCLNTTAGWSASLTLAPLYMGQIDPNLPSTNVTMVRLLVAFPI